MRKIPRALAFQWRAINTLLIEVAESLGTRPQETLYEPISDLIALKYANPSGDPRLGAGLAPDPRAALEDLNAAAGQLSEQLTSQHFSHVDFELRAVSA